MSFSQRAQGPAQKPNPIAVLSEIVYGYQREGVLAYEMPSDPQGAAKWFMGRMEPQQRYEGLKLNRGKGGEEFWEFPYLERLCYLLKKYYHLPDCDQAVVLGCCDEKVFWHGESMDHYYNNEHSVYNEVMIMREQGIKKYQPEAVEMMKSMNFGMERGVEPSVAVEEDVEF